MRPVCEAHWMKNWRETVRGYRPFLRRAAFASLLGLPVGCVLGGVVFEVATMRPPYDGSNVMGQALIAALFGAGFGFIPCAVYGVPAAALLARHGYDNVLSALVVGVLPGFGLWMMMEEANMASLAILFGGCVALSTHVVAQVRQKREARRAG